MAAKGPKACTKSPSAASLMTRMRGRRSARSREATAAASGCRAFTAVPGTPPASPPAWRGWCSAPAPRARARSPIAARSAGGSARARPMAAGQRRRVAGRHAPAGDALLHRLARGAEVGGDHRPGHGLRLDHRAAEGFRVGGGVDHHVGQQQRRGHVLGVAAEAHPFAEAEFADARGERPAQAALAHQQRDRVAGQPRHRVEQHRLALPARQPAGQHHHRAALRHVPRPAERGDAGRRHGGGVEAPLVHAARDDAQPRRIGAVAGAQVLGDEAADGDDALAARHDGVVEALARPALVVGAVVGGDEVRAGAPRRQQRRPGRGAGAGVDDADLLPRAPARASAAALRQMPSGDLRPSGSVDVPRAQALQRPDQRPAGGGDERAPAGGDQRLGDLQGAALHAAGDQGGQHLQHGAGQSGAGGAMPARAARSCSTGGMAGCRATPFASASARRCQPRSPGRRGASPPASGRVGVDGVLHPAGLAEEGVASAEARGVEHQHEHRGAPAARAGRRGRGRRGRWSAPPPGGRGRCPCARPPRRRAGAGCRRGR